MFFHGWCTRDSPGISSLVHFPVSTGLASGSQMISSTGAVQLKTWAIGEEKKHLLGHSVWRG